MKVNPFFLACMLISGSCWGHASELESLRAQRAALEAKIKTLEEKSTSNDDSKQSNQSNDSKSKANSNFYTIRKGDHLEKIARSLKCSTAALASINGLKSNTVIHPGQKLKVPNSATRPVSEQPKAESAPAVATSYKEHVIREGETYTSIAKKYGTTAGKLISANPSAKPTALRGGMKIRIPVRASSAPVSAPAIAKKAPAAPVEKEEKAAVAKTAPKSEARPANPEPAPVAHSESREPQTTPAPSASKPFEHAEAPAAKAPEPKPIAAATTPAPAPARMAESTPAPASPVPASSSTAKIRPVTIEGEVSFGDFANKHGTDVARLNSLNGLDLTGSTVLAKGSELYVPAPN